MMSVGIVGLGRVGFPLAVAFAEAGQDVAGVDSSAARVAELREALAGRAEQIHLSTRLDALGEADAVVICVPTPLTPNREPDLLALLGACRAVVGVLRPGHLVVLESTTYPGTTRERVLPILEESGLMAGRDFFLAFSPERSQPGHADCMVRTTPRVVAGLTDGCGDRAEKLYRLVCDQVVRVSAPEVAEMSNLLENVFHAVNTALVNELAELADRIGIDIHEVVDAAATKPSGFMGFRPGPSAGTLAADPFLIAWKAREHDAPTELVELAGKLNQQAPQAAVEKIQRALNDAGKPVRGSRILVVGVASAAGGADPRDGVASRIIGRLGRLGAEIDYHDPHVASLPAFGVVSRDLDDALQSVDMAVVVTAHPDVDHDVVARAVPTVDLSGATYVTRFPSPYSSSEER